MAGSETKDSDFITVGQVAEILGVRKPNVYRIKDLPKPVGEGAGGRIWRRSHIEKFAEKFAARRRVRAER